MKPSSLLALAVALAATGSVHAKCNVTLKLKNQNSKAVTALGDESKARVNGGFYSAMNFGKVTIQPGDTRDVAWVTNMSCDGGAKRDLRIAYQESGSNQTFEEVKNDIDVEPGVPVNVTLKR